MDEKSKSRYIDLHFSYFGGPDDGVIEFQKVKVVRTSKPHSCAIGNKLHTIPAGVYAVSEPAKYDGTVGTCYSCLPCLDRWAKDIGE